MLINGSYPDWAPGYRLWVANWPLAHAVPTANQLDQGQLINAFSHAFGPGYWDVVTRAGLAGITDQRDAEYRGPALQSLANLTAAEQAALEQQLMQIVGG